MLELFKTNLHLFDANTQTTESSGLSAEMKEFYEKQLIRLAGPYLVHDMFGQKKPIPKNNGKVIKFRKYDSLPKALTPLTEGVTPDGQPLNVTEISATVHQYGAYITLSDMLLLTAIDNNQTEAVELLADQAGRTLDTVTREVLNGGTNVLYAGSAADRAALVGGESSGNTYLTPNDIKKAAKILKDVNAKTINGKYAAIIHPDCWFDFTATDEWKAPHQYVDSKNIYDGTLGEWAGVRFYESTEAKIFCGDDLASDTRTLLVNGVVSSSTTVNFDGSTAGVEAHALKGRTVIIGTNVCEVTDNTTTALTLKTAISASDNEVIYPGEGGSKGRAVYSTLVIAQNAYGVTELEGGGLQYIAKQLGSGDDPLNQRATCGWKATKTAERLVETYMVRVEACSTTQAAAN